MCNRQGIRLWLSVTARLVAGLLLVPIVLTGCRVAPGATLAPLRSASIKLGDITMYLEEYGGGEPLILLNGGLNSTAAWVNQIPALSRRYHVIALDSRAQGRTTDSEAPITYHLMAEDTLRLMDHLGIDAAYVVGWSDGGNIGLDLAIHHPGRVRALVAYAANTTPEGLTETARAYLRDTPVDELQKGLSDDYRGLCPQPERLPIIVEKIRTMWLTEPNFTADELASIKAPTLIMQGQNDDLVRADHARSIAQAIPGAEFMLLADADHHAMTRKPKEWNNAVLRFLKDK